MTVNSRLVDLFQKTRSGRARETDGRGKECQHHVGILE